MNLIFFPFKLIYKLITLPFRILFLIITSPFRLIIFLTKQIGKFLTVVLLIIFYLIIFGSSLAIGLWLITQPLYWVLFIPLILGGLVVALSSKPKNI